MTTADSETKTEMIYKHRIVVFLLREVLYRKSRIFILLCNRERAMLVESIDF